MICAICGNVDLEWKSEPDLRVVEVRVIGGNVGMAGDIQFMPTMWGSN